MKKTLKTLTEIKWSRLILIVFLALQTSLIFNLYNRTEALRTNIIEMSDTF